MMKNNKLALPDRFLLSIDKPARYTGNEINAVHKDAEQIAIRFAMCFPDVYEIGMSHIGLQILYDMMNRREDTWCERVFSPWTDLDALMRKEHIPLFALESQDAVRGFDFLGITLQYEMCYTNVLQVLELSGIPLLAKERTLQDPLVIGGGPCAFNPEPLADFFDLFYIGEGETVYNQLLDVYRDHKKAGGTREDFLFLASRIPGIYVPSLYTVCYHPDGTIASFSPVRDDVPQRIEKQVDMQLSDSFYPKAPVVPFIKATQDRVALEIQRGCIRGCRFCQAGMIYRPNRERSLAFLKDAARHMLDATGYEEISLSSLSSSDYSQLGELLSFLIEEYKDKGVNISLPSLRIDAFSLEVMNKVQDIRKSSLTFAPEAGTQRMRDVINKGLTEEEILGGAAQAFSGGWSRVKLYFMLGLPGEDEEDVKGIARLAQKIADCYYDLPKEERHGKCQINVSTSFFIPKPFTPFQWTSMYKKQDYLDKAAMVRQEIREQKNQRCISYHWHEVELSLLEGVLARGDRKLGAVLLAAYRNGAMFDSWTENFHPEYWDDAFASCGVDPEFYTARKRDTSEILPWDFIDAGVERAYLEKEWDRAREGIVTKNCREQCNGCGCTRYAGGVCFEGQR